jgi:hypothetical protein
MARPIPVLPAAFANAVAVMRLWKRHEPVPPNASILHQLMDGFTKGLPVEVPV